MPDSQTDVLGTAISMIMVLMSKLAVAVNLRKKTGNNSFFRVVQNYCHTFSRTDIGFIFSAAGSSASGRHTWSRPSQIKMRVCWTTFKILTIITPE